MRDLDKTRAQLDSQTKGLKARLEYLDRSEKEQIALVAKNARQKDEWEGLVAQLQEKLVGLADQIQALHERMAGRRRPATRPRRSTTPRWAAWTRCACSSAT